MSHPERGVFAMMDRDGRPLPPERVRWDGETTGLNIGRMAEAALNAERGALPERPYDRGSKECGFCSYHTLCWGERKAVPWDRRPHLETGDPELVLAAET